MKKVNLLAAVALMCGMATASINAYADDAKATTETTTDANAPVLTFKQTSHDFGTFAEEKGKVTCTFSFTNTGKSDLVLQKVRASCGCTTPNWTKTPIAPGDTGFVTATYNASGRPGAFTKSITVTSNAGADQRLTIKGEVIPRVKKPEEEYPFNIGDLRLKNQNVYMRTIEYPNTKTEKIQILNNGDAPINISFMNAPKYLTLKANPATIEPKKKGTIEVTFDSKEANDWGEMHANFDVAVNGKVEKNKQITVNATIRESFANMTAEQKAKAPVLKVDNVFDLGTVELGKKKKVYKFYFTNNGESALMIRKIKTSNENVKIEYPTKPVAKGKKGEIKITINSENNKAGKFNMRATIISNDPNHSVTGLTLTGEYK